MAEEPREVDRWAVLLRDGGRWVPCLRVEREATADAIMFADVESAVARVLPGRGLVREVFLVRRRRPAMWMKDWGSECG